ncbi:MAG: GNAT family N-acetyltransferase [Microcoleaceae cyanobacterium]
MIVLPILTKRLIIRPFIPEDLSAYLEFMLDAESTQYLALEPDQKTQAGATELFNFVLSSYHTDSVIHAYAIAMKDSNQYIGSCGYSPDEDTIFELFYSINSNFRRLGYAFEAMKALLTTLQSSDKITEIRAYSHPENLASLKLAEKLGMEYQGEAIHVHSRLKGILYRLKLNS